MKTINVATKKPYNVYLTEDNLASFSAYLAYPKTTRFVIITDDKVGRLYLNKVKTSIKKAGYEVLSYVVASGETSKSMETYQACLNYLAENELTRQDVLIALGGGVVGDLTGFLAATYLRGIAFISLPTTLLAMVDSSVGGKTGINLTRGKNLCGAFKQPDFVYISTATLLSLDECYFREGLAEVIKYALIGEKSLLTLLGQEKIEKDSLRLVELIALSVQKKADIVIQDEFERGERKLLNFGHTFAHAIEKVSDYHYRHGQAVAIGMYMVMKGALKNSLIEKKTLDCLKSLLQIQGLDYKCSLDKEALLQAALYDKKRQGKQLTLVLANEVGGFLHTIDIALLDTFLVGDNDED